MSNQYSVDPIPCYSEVQQQVLSLLDRIYDYAQLEQKYTDRQEPVPAPVECASVLAYDKMIGLIAALSVPREHALSLLACFYDLAQLEQKYTEQQQPVPQRIQVESLRVYDELLTMVAGLPRATDKRKRHDGK